jgi:alpha/beta superfamily hydrolase
MRPVRFQTADGLSLVCEVHEAEGHARGSAVICHPHPRHGGSKDHPLLWAIRGALVRRGLTVLAFNFRGIMGSEGTFGSGVDEIEDVRAAVGRVRQSASGPTLAVGWSFGASVALREAVQDRRVAALALVGFPLSETSLHLPPPPGRDELAALGRPVLFVVGQADQFSPLPELRRLARRIPGSEIAVIPDTDHFFWKREKEVADRIGAFADAVLAGWAPDGGGTLGT